MEIGVVSIAVALLGLLCMIAIIRIHSNVTKIVWQLERITKLLEDRIGRAEVDEKGIMTK